MKIKFLLILVWVVCAQLVYSQSSSFDQIWNQKFEQLGSILPTPNSYRSASGSPGSDYWQQRVDYKMKLKLDDDRQHLDGEETITYFNQSPNPLSYLWVQLDQNMLDEDSNTPKVTSEYMRDTLSAYRLESMLGDFDYNGGFNIESVTNMNDSPLEYTINKTMMRIDLDNPLEPGQKFVFNVKWNYSINDRMKFRERSGYEYFPKDENYLYTIAQFYPRLCKYTDQDGWQNKQFLGRGEFTLEFGNFDVEITVPSDFVVGATGTLQNQAEVLTEQQLKRLEKSKTTYDVPVIIITEEEALENEKSRSTETKTWKFNAENVRDFAWVGSRKFIWDAMAVDINGKKPLAMSFYPKEGNPLWEIYSTRAVANTLKTYSKHTIDYPYPVAISVHTASIGMEYPMICFNWGRPNENGEYSDLVKWRMIGVIIHEVGHNFFPMIINSDERQWTWMDEGLNTFCQYLTEKEYYPALPSRRGPAKQIVDYMKGNPEFIRPIMTNSEQVIQFGNNAYGKPAAALNILREVVMGPELFDHAFKTYAQRWAFKSPSPSDFFRTMEDASAVDLDWFWRGWFYTTDNVDIGVQKVKWLKVAETATIEGRELKADSKKSKKKKNTVEQAPISFAEVREDFVLSNTQDREYWEFMNRLDDEQIRLESRKKNYYEITFSNLGGLVMPIIIEWTFKDGSSEIEQIPAEIWRYNENLVTKVFAKDKEVTKIKIDPNKMTADVDVSNNAFPKEITKSKFDNFKDKN